MSSDIPPPAATEAAIAAMRQQVSDLHQELVRYRLVVWTAGNVSGRVPGHDLFVIKPSGVDYDALTPDAMIVCDLDGNVVHGDLSPSSDTAAHAYVYRHMPEVGGVVHTHSTYACAWAARGEPVPCVLTAMADEFGAEIPVGPFALIGDDSIGRGITETLRGHRSPAVLMRNHGVFTIGRDPRAAVKAAVMCEDVARTVHISRQLGDPLPIAAADVDRLYDRYQNVYGQPGGSGGTSGASEPAEPAASVPAAAPPAPPVPSGSGTQALAPAAIPAPAESAAASPAPSAVHATQPGARR